MKKLQKTLSVMLCAAMVLGTAACSSDSGGNGGNLNDIVTDSNGEMSFTEAPIVEIDEDTPTGKVVYLSYEAGFEENANNKMVALFEQRYGGSFEHIMCTSGNGYFEKLGTLIATGSSPDLVRYEWRSYPYAISYNMYTPLDTYIDIDSDLWKDMKPIADQFLYNGKHYYYPYMIATNFAVNYNNRVLQENGMEDPMDLLRENRWTWSTFENMLKQWCDMDPRHVGYSGVGGMIFVLSTGVKTVDIQGDQIINNLKNENISRCMQWLEGLNRQGLVNLSDEKLAMGYTVSSMPDSAFIDGNLLFLGMGPDWTYSAAKESLDKNGLENEMKFVPFPRDELADKYYIGIDTFGYLIPSGAPNVKGAVDWINMHRIEYVDEDNRAKEKAEATSTDISYYPKCANKDCGDTSDSHDDKGRHIFTEEEEEAKITVCPSCGTERRVKYKVVWSEEQWDLCEEMKSTDGRFTGLFDHCYGFGDDVNGLFDGEEGLLDGAIHHGYSYTFAVESKYSVLEGYLNHYRDLMKKNAAGELVTYPVDETDEAA